VRLRDDFDALKFTAIDRSIDQCDPDDFDALKFTATD
jgi:hypothetical protein